MALGGGTWQFQNKILPGTYINFASKVRAEADISERGYATMALPFDWGPENVVFPVTAEEFQEKSLSIFGYDYTADELKGLRDLFINAKTVYFYRLSNNAVAAKNSMGTAKYAGARGNDITTEVATDVDDTDTFDVKTYIKVDGINTLVDNQKQVKAWTDVTDNDYVRWGRAGGAMVATAGTPMTGGSNGDEITGAQYQAYIDAISSYYFNTMGYPGTDQKIQSLLINFCKRMRDDVGSKFQLVLYGMEGVDYEGVISIANKATDSGASPASLVYWLTGAEASCAINASLTNSTYNGEYTVDTNYSQRQLASGIQQGRLLFHNVHRTVSGELVGEIKVLTDINTFTSFVKKKNSDFSLNQVIRVLDQDATDIANLFNRQYLGSEQNDDDGRTALWGDIVALHKEYQRVRAIQNFKAEDIPVPTQGTQKTAVLLSYEIQPTCCMEKLYVNVIVA
ncbi:phage tail sheath subtilisin-like domain-containing protein [uncultured Dialister sp.]|uniref:phage tail sheath subtilisin-like domain-containing protein n=1 Tax=uncultured Dialister sp. TaxID=278064 RepID=UPI0027DE359A|nr:phage tail sheath subtilisin-like domain-containing protein [uncultured Dialister sp.]